MQALIEFLSKHAGLFVTLVGSGWLMNTLSSLVIGKVAKYRASKWWAFVKVLHGILDRIDPPEVPKAAKVVSISLAVVCLTACGYFHASSPCPGLYCITGDFPGLPGSGKLCYDTDEERALQIKEFEARGIKVQRVNR